MYHEENISSPYFLRVGNLTAPALVNGAWENITFIVYVLPTRVRPMAGLVFTTYLGSS